MNKKYKYIVFDFDGVVCDSTNECMVTAWNAWERWNERDGFRCILDEFTQAEIDSFRPLRPYVRGAGEYYILMRAINTSDVIIRSQQDFDDLQQQWENQLNPFKEIFFMERNRLRKENLNSWIKLHDVYTDVINVMKKLHNEGRLLIATMKDSESVKLILIKNGINISPENILDQSQISSKLEALDYFVVDKNIKKEELCFIDDNVTHLLAPHNAGYDVYLTTWGKVMNEYLDIAKTNNLNVLSDCSIFINN
jgi:phosphoglycolate phosphatase-like HAD superfamily hydrolase